MCVSLTRPKTSGQQSAAHTAHSTQYVVNSTTTHDVQRAT